MGTYLLIHFELLAHDLRRLYIKLNQKRVSCHVLVKISSCFLFERKKNTRLFPNGFIALQLVMRSKPFYSWYTVVD